MYAFFHPRLPINISDQVAINRSHVRHSQVHIFGSRTCATLHLDEALNCIGIYL